MTYVTTKNFQTPTTQDPYNVSYDDFEDGDMEAVEPSEDYFPEEAGPQGPAVPQTANEMRAYLRDLQQEGKLSDEEYQQNLRKINQAAGFSEPDRLQVFSEIYQQVSGQAASAEGDYYADADAPKVSSRQITELLNELKSGQVQSTDDSMSTEKCIDTLKQALTDERNHHSNRAAAEFREVLDAIGGEEAIDPKNIAGNQLGMTPNSIDPDGTFRFDGHGAESGSDFDLKSPGNGSRVVVDNATSVSLTPKNASDTVTISEEGNYYVIQMGSDTFKVSQDAKLNIVSDHVTGNVDNPDNNITVGAAKPSNYLSPEKMQEMSKKITSAMANIGKDKTYHSSTDTNTNHAREILEDMATALAETDPKKRAEAWQTVNDELYMLGSQGMATGHVNDTVQLVFNVLFDQFGQAGLKDALKQGMIPADIATNLANQLMINTGENTTEDYKQASGGPSWTHQTSANFLNQYKMA